MEMQELVATLFALKEEKSRAESAVDQVKSEISIVEQQLIDMMVETGQTSAKFAEIGSVSLTVQSIPSIKDEDLFFNFLKETKQDGMIKYTVNSNTLRGWWNTLENELSPDDIGLDVYKRPRINTRRA